MSRALNTDPKRPLGHDRRQLWKRVVQSDAAIVANSRAICAALDEVALVAPTDGTVLLLGETGVGKEVFAHAIHDASPRRGRPMVCFNVAAIPDALVESELFGHERGAFTDAVRRQIGRFEAANGSTLFLDEIGELSLETQVKLLQVLERRTIERVGSGKTITLDIRIIAATNRDLEQAVRDGRFREDLFYRLNVFPITIAPLRERREDIPDLAWMFVAELSRKYGKRIESIAPESLRDLHQYSWPGNVRELRNLIERAMIVAEGPTLVPEIPDGKLLPLSGKTLPSQGGRT